MGSYWRESKRSLYYAGREKSDKVRADKSRGEEK